MLEQPTQAINHIERRAFIGGSDARIIICDDAPALLHRRLNRGEAEPQASPPTSSSKLA